ncbi:MAG: outer membrane protein assembly factor BamC [Rhodoferax sp.]|nr:outer membrane protein assembly factor BamC [Rhodoferax sp.]
MKSIFKLGAVCTAVAVVGCSALESDKVDYRSTAKAPSLVVPPDLTQMSKDTRYTVVDGGISASGVKTAPAASDPSTLAAAAIGDVRMERTGNQRWLVVKRPADKLWTPIKDFWLENGFALTMEQAALGIMETDWAENRAKIPQDMIRNSLGKIFDSLYSTAERDKYRTRLETNANGETEIYISHRGVQEVYTQERSSQTVWQPSPANPELEAEFLRRLMVQLGAGPEQVQSAVSGSVPKAAFAKLISKDGNQVVEISADFDRAWRQVGLTLDRTGFTVENRDRKQGIYFVRYVSDTEDTDKPGFLANLFGAGKKQSEPAKFQIALTSQGDKTLASVLSSKGTPESSQVAQRISKVIADDLQ